MLREWAGVDVLRGLVKRTYDSDHAVLFPIERWEPEPSLPRDYQRLRAYITNKSIDALI